ncbi:hypothetical protein [Vulgatibacter incomptus]|uniref:Outer membrane protein beta-barrel domain-containing protein n=1 Tax=Vulgatibacter incomptus TaxID=1391653 RepID=A0A0K1PI10_9BACT|nr:hypothetical protein [Vulgatibacter incomptus]AKU93152.1 hypothetical protein AKJ08_3539 [Vulgatibacter incomptus]
MFARKSTTLALFLALLSCPILAQALEVSQSPSEAKESSLHLDLEVDPTAFVFGGYSLHAGIGWQRFRLDLGAFAMDVPEAYHGQKAFEQSFHGFGAKLAYFLFADQTGGFVGVGAGIARGLYGLKGTELAAQQYDVGIGPHVGWRFDLGAGFYATPWISLDYSLNPKDVTLGGETFASDRWSVFPAIHLGRRFM